MALARLEKLAAFDEATILLLGESGTGKTVLAQHLHDRSPRARRIFHRVALSSIADTLAPSELFGHVPGAFTDARTRRAGHFAVADGGTLFLDELGKASELVQHKLLDAIERKEVTPLGADQPTRVNVRLVTATNVCLDRLVDEGRFLPDLAARLEGFAVTIPPLRARRDDIPALVDHLAGVHGSSFGYPAGPPAWEPELLDVMRDAAWPNNIRQLESTVCALMIEAAGAPVILRRHCTTAMVQLKPARRRGQMDAEVVQEALRNNESKAMLARKLGVSRSTLYRHLDALPAPRAD